MSPTDNGNSSVWARVRVIVGIAVSGICLVLLVWNVDWAGFWAALRQADYRWLVPAVATTVPVVWFKVVKWQLLLRPTKETSSGNVFYSMMVGYLVNTVLPGRLGEVARVYLLARLERISPVAVLSTVGVDRVLDLVMLALLLAIALQSASLPWLVVVSALAAGLGAVVLLAVCILLAYPRGRALFLRLLGASPRFPGKALVERWAEALCLGVQGLRGFDAQWKIAVSTLGVWLATIFTFYFTQLAFHIEAPPWAAVLALALTGLGMAVPSTPGYVGVYQLVVVLAMGAYGVEKEVAFGYAVVMHLVGLLPVNLAGVYSLWRCGISLMGWKETRETGDTSSLKDTGLFPEPGSPDAKTEGKVVTP